MKLSRADEVWVDEKLKSGMRTPIVMARLAEGVRALLFQVRVEICSELSIPPKNTKVGFDGERGLLLDVDPPATWKAPGFFPPPAIASNNAAFNAAQREIIESCLDRVGQRFRDRFRSMALSYRTAHVSLSISDSGMWRGVSTVTGHAHESPLVRDVVAGVGVQDWELFRSADADHEADQADEQADA